MEMVMTDTKPHIDVLLVVPLAEELACIFNVFPYQSDHSGANFQLNKIKSPTDEISVYLVKLREMGNAAARDACNFVLDRYTVGLVICCGIAGGIKKDLMLGDVCVSHRILDISDQFKVEDKKGVVSIAPSPKHLEVDINLGSRLAFMCEHPQYANLKDGWKEACLEFYLTIEAEHSSIFEHVKKYIREEVGVFFGSIVSYAVVASDTFSETLKALDRNVLAVETESAGVFEVAKHYDTPVITVRGVSDFADNKKTEIEVQSKNVVRSIAAMNAAYYIYYQLCSSTVVGFLNDRKNALISAQTGELFPKQRIDPLDALLRQVEEDIDLELKDKCPAYRHKPKRSLLPSPRVLRVGGPTDPDKSRDWDVPIETADIVEQCERLLISLEPTYPDRALPCRLIQRGQGLSVDFDRAGLSVRRRGGVGI